MILDFSGLFDNVITQVIVIIAFIGIISIIVAIVTQSFGKGIATFGGCIVVIVCILLLKDAQEIGEWLRDKIWVGNTEDGGQASIGQKIQMINSVVQQYRYS